MSSPSAPFLSEANMGVNDVGAGLPMNGSDPNPPELTQWGSVDPKMVGQRPVDMALGDMKEREVFCPDCDFKTSFPDNLKQHKADCERQRKAFAERKQNEGISEEKVLELIEKANRPIVSALENLASILAPKQAEEAPKKKKRGRPKKKVEPESS